MKRILLFLLIIISKTGYTQTEDWYGPASISFYGFICNRPTNDDPLGGDGVSDEVTVHIWDWVAVANNRANFNGMSKIYGEAFLLPDRIKAGTATINGGIKAGDSYYRGGEYGDNDPNILVNSAIVNIFCSQSTIVAILPTIWEHDNGPLAVTPVQDFGVAANRAFGDVPTQQYIQDFSLQYTYDDSNPFGFFVAGRHFGLDAKFAGLFTANKNKLASRPIGLFSNWDYSSELIIMTPKIIKIISDKDYGYGKGILPVHFNEETMGNTFGHGNYILLLKFVSDIKDRNANNPVTYSVGVKVNNIAAGEEYKFRFRSGARFDSLTIKAPNSTANFPTKIVAGQQYYVTQSSGPRNCQLTNFIGTISKDTITIANCGSTAPAPPPASSSNKLGMSYSSSLMSNKERFEFALAGTSERIVIDADHRQVYFSKLFRAGETYSITQTLGPRTCNFSGQNQGAIGNTDKLITITCGNPPLSIFKMNITGVEQGESFSFSDSHGRSFTIPRSGLINLGGYPQGDTYSITQTAGPRQCIITPYTGTVPTTPRTIQCDCKKPVVNTPPPKPTNVYDLVTRSSDNKILNSYYESWAPVIGGKNENEGRYVAFSMTGKGIDGSSGNYRQIYWRDRKEGITKLISKSSTGEEANASSFAPAISADGQSVAFESYATNLSNGDNNGVRDVFVWNAQSNNVTLVSRSQAGTTANSESYEPVISGDGSVIAYTSNASDIVTLGPVFSTPNVYVNTQGSTIFITKDHETGKAVGGYSPSISEDGNKIAFCAYNNRLVKNDNNNLWDIFLWENGKQELKRISMTAAGGERDQGNESSSRVVWPAISGDGNSIAYATTSTNIVNDDANGMQDIFLYNIASGSSKRISTVNSGIDGDGDSPISQGERVGISYDGNWITYNTNASNLGVPKGNIVTQNTETGKIIPVTSFTNGSSARPMISANGNYVVAGCSERYDKRFVSSGIFVFFIDHTK